MTPTRRDILKIAAAAATATPFVVSPEQAAALLVQPARFAPAVLRGNRGWTADADATDPIHFAASIDATDWAFEELLQNGSPAELAEYNQALDALIDLDPARLEPHSGGIDHPVARLDEAALALWSAAWLAGVAAGVQYEHLRLALVRPVMTCQTCYGHGRLWAGSWCRKDAATPSEPCGGCGGRGTVPTPRPRLPDTL